MYTHRTILGLALAALLPVHPVAAEPASPPQGATEEAAEQPVEVEAEEDSPTAYQVQEAAQASILDKLDHDGHLTIADPRTEQDRTLRLIEVEHETLVISKEAAGRVLADSEYDEGSNVATALNALETDEFFVGRSSFTDVASGEAVQVDTWMVSVDGKLVPVADLLRSVAGDTRLSYQGLASSDLSGM